MSENVIQFPSKSDTQEELEDFGNPIHMIYEALTEIVPDLESLIVIGQDVEGKFFFASSSLKKADVLYDLKTAEYVLMS